MSQSVMVLFGVALLFPMIFAADIAADITTDICIIGAGPSGIQAAYTAEAKGYSVAVIEKNTYVGGGTKMIHVGSVKYRMGASLHVASKKNSLVNLFQKFDVPALGGGGNFQFYTSDGADVNYSLNYLGLFLQGFFHVLTRRSLERKYLGPEGLLSDYPKELNEPLFDWLQDNFMSAFQDVFWMLWTAFGYGDTRDAPAVYALKAATISTIWGLGARSIPIIGGIFSPTGTYPYQELLEKMAGSLKGNVYLNATITNVTYEVDSNMVTFTQNGGEKELVADCGATIVAFHQTADSMPVFIPPDNEGATLSNLLNQVESTNYFTLLLEDAESHFADKMTDKWHVPAPSVPDNPAVPLFISKQHDIPGSSVVAYYLSPSEKTDKEATEETLATYSALIGQVVNSSIVQDFNRWEGYFPHVSTESMNSGFYRDFDGLQGKFHQYYAGGLFAVDTVQESMEHAKYIVERFFAD